MPIVETDSYRTKADYYSKRARLWIAVLAGGQALYAIFVAYTIYTSPPTPLNKIPDLIEGIIGVDSVFLLWWPIWRIIANRKMVSRLLAPPQDLSVQTLVFHPALRNEEPVTITVVFQWPKEFDIVRDNSGNVIAPSIPITPTNLKDRFSSDVSTALLHLYEKYSTQLPNPQEVYKYKTSSVDTAIFKSVDYVVRQCGVPYLKYDCTKIEPPVVESPKAAPEAPKRILT